VQRRNPHARVGLLALAAALMAVLVAVPSAGAAQFAGGPITLDFKASKFKVAMKGQDTATDTKTRGTFAFTEAGAGTVTMNSSPSGSLTIGSGTTEVTLTHANKKKIVLKSLVEKLSGGKGQITAKVNGKGGAVAFFDQATTNKLKVASDFTALTLETSNMTLTSKGAAALNKAFGLKPPAKGKKDLRLKKKAKMGTARFTANRQLIITGGQSQTLYDKAFYDQLKSCGITLGSVEPATPIAQDPANPDHRGGVSLPVRDGIMDATTRFGSINHTGGTVLDRPEGGAGKAKYNSPLTDFIFTFDPTKQELSSFVANISNRSPTGTVTGTIVTTLTDLGGTVTLQGELVLSPVAATLLSDNKPPLGADCPIPAGSKIGAVSMTANAN
jgi:hypothetical protein